MLHAYSTNIALNLLPRDACALHSFVAVLHLLRSLANTRGTKALACLLTSYSGGWGISVLLHKLPKSYLMYTNISANTT